MEQEYQPQQQPSNPDQQSSSQEPTPSQVHSSKRHSQWWKNIHLPHRHHRSERPSFPLGNRLLTLVIIALAIVALLLIGKPKLPNLNPFKHHEVTIDDTEMLLTQIREINELTTAGFCDEMVMHYTKEGTRLLTTAPDEIVIVVKGKVRAGFDLSGIDSTKVKARGDSVWIVLPQAEIFDVLVNPSDIRIFAQEGKWSHQQVTKIEKEASKRLRQRAIDNGILDKASHAGTARISEMLYSLGYTAVFISIEQPQPVAPVESKNIPLPSPAQLLTPTDGVLIR